MKRGSHGDAFLKLLGTHGARTIPGVAHPHQLHRRVSGRKPKPDFQELYDFVAAARSSHWMGVFEYSDVDNAGQLSLSTAKWHSRKPSTDRRNRLMALQKKISREIFAS